MAEKKKKSKFQKCKKCGIETILAKCPHCGTFIQEIKIKD